MFTYEDYVKDLKNMGLQSTELYNAIKELNRMLSFRELVAEDEERDSKC